MFRSIIILILCITLTLGIKYETENCIHGKKMYIPLGASGKYNSKSSQENIVHNEDAVLNKCNLTIITCPSCIIFVKFKFYSEYEQVRNDVWIYEPPFEDIKFNISQKNTYESLTHVLKIVTNPRTKPDFILEYFSKSNRKFFNYVNDKSNGIISSPFFPNFYHKDLIVEHIINCNISTYCRIQLIFTDFQIAESSFIEIYDTNGHLLFITEGLIFRPPILTSFGQQLVIKFYGNGDNDIGFKAKYLFLTDSNDTLLSHTQGDCGGYVTNLGGKISMFNMVYKNLKLYDCYWIIRPLERSWYMKSHWYLKLINFQNFAEDNELIIRSGFTSKDTALEQVKLPFTRSINQEHVVPISEGFYISFRGIFNINSSLIISYTAFTYKECFLREDFLCKNERCIPSYLVCDGYDHCGDESDENINCKKDYHFDNFSVEANFYFPFVIKDNDLRIASLIFIICTIGLFAIMFAFIHLLCRINRRTNNNLQFQTHIQTINYLLEEEHISGTEEDILIDDSPPLYEDPPNYEDVIKNMFKNQQLTANVLNIKSKLVELKDDNHTRQRKYMKFYSLSDSEYECKKKGSKMMKRITSCDCELL